MAQQAMQQFAKGLEAEDYMKKIHSWNQPMMGGVGAQFGSGVSYAAPVAGSQVYNATSLGLSNG